MSEKGWNKLNNVGDIKEVEVKALFNLIDKDRSGELSLDVRIGVSGMITSLYLLKGGKKGLPADPSKI